MHTVYEAGSYLDLETKNAYYRLLENEEIVDSLMRDFGLDPEHGHDRDRNIDTARGLHLDEIVQTRLQFFEQQELVKERMKKYKEKEFPAL